MNPTIPKRRPTRNSISPNVPIFDGSSFLHNLKISGFYRDTPVIILSGAINLEDRVSQMKFELDAYIPKPFNPVQLKEAISDVFKKYEAVEH